MPADLVIIENGCVHSASTSIIERVMPQPPLHGLIGVGGRADVEQQRHVARLRERLAQALGRVDLGDDARLEVEPGERFR